MCKASFYLYAQFLKKLSNPGLLFLTIKYCECVLQRYIIRDKSVAELLKCLLLGETSVLY